MGLRTERGTIILKVTEVMCMVENVLAVSSFLVFCINKALPFIFQGTWCVTDKLNCR